MNALERDLIRWENGEMTLEQVERAHPEAGVRELMRLHTRLSMLRAISLPDVEKAWSMTLPMLDRGMTSEPVRSPARSSRLRDWARRPLAASFAAVVMSGGAAYAAGFEPVQRAVDRVWDRAKEVTGLEGSDEEESTSVAPSDDDASAKSSGASAPGRERADEVRGQGREKGPNHGRRAFGHSHKKDNDASGTEHVPGSPPAHARNDEAKKPDKDRDKDKDKDKDNNGSGAPDAPGNSGNNGGGNGVPVEEPEENTASAGGAPPAPEIDSPGASGEDHGNANGKDKDK